MAKFTFIIDGKKHTKDYPDKPAGWTSTSAPIKSLAATPQFTPPNPLEMATNFGKAMWAWKASGFALANEAELNARRAICEACPEFKPAAYFGLGKCRRCGCSKFKLWMASSKCPIGKW